MPRSARAARSCAAVIMPCLSPAKLCPAYCYMLHFLIAMLIVYGSSIKSAAGNRPQRNAPIAYGVVEPRPAAAALRVRCRRQAHLGCHPLVGVYRVDYTRRLADRLVLITADTSLTRTA